MVAKVYYLITQLAPHVIFKLGAWVINLFIRSILIVSPNFKITKGNTWHKFIMLVKLYLLEGILPLLISLLLLINNTNFKNPNAITSKFMPYLVDEQKYERKSVMQGMILSGRTDRSM